VRLRHAILLLAALLILLSRGAFAMPPPQESDEKQKKTRKAWDELSDEERQKLKDRFRKHCKGKTQEEKQELLEKLAELDKKSKKDRDRLREWHKKMREAEDRLKKAMSKELREKVAKLPEETQHRLLRYAMMQTYRVHREDLRAKLTPKQRKELEKLDRHQKWPREMQYLREWMHTQLPKEKREEIAALPEKERRKAFHIAWKPVMEKMLADARTRVLAEIEAEFKKPEKELKAWLKKVTERKSKPGRYGPGRGGGRDRKR
jgi:hypothetical protein